MDNVDKIIVGLGGNVKVAAGIGVSPSGVSEMKRRGSIPVTHWPALIRFAGLQGRTITNDDLVRIHTTHSESTAA